MNPDKEIGLISIAAAMRILVKAVELHTMVKDDTGNFRLREGLFETPERAAKAWQHWCGGYDIDVPTLLKCFTDGAEGADQLVVQCDIPFHSHCEHHLAPIFGRVCVGYIPQGKIVGLSKMNRVVDAFARRLQTQERLGNQIADALWQGLEPVGVGVVIKARHFCIESRGVEHQGCTTTTSALRGAIRDETSARAEFFSLAKFEAVI